MEKTRYAISLVNCEIDLILAWSEDCVLADMITRAAGAVNLLAINAPTNATFEITGTKLYVSVVTSSTQDDNKLLKQLGTGFKRTIKRNKYRSEGTNETKKTT